MKRRLASFRAKSEVVPDHFSQVKKHRSSNQTPRTMFFRERKFTVCVADWLWLKPERFFHHCHSVSKSQCLYNKMTYQDRDNCVFTWLLTPRGLPKKNLTIVPQARMGCESIAHEAEGWMGYWLRGHEGERNNCFSKIQPVGQKYRE